MLFANKKPEERRRDLKAALESGRIIQMPGAHEPIVARIIEEFDFDGIYISGGALSASLAMPDIGLTTMTEVIQRGRQISRVTDLPSLIDLDTGFGEAMNTARAIQECEESGISGCHIEDQLSPKRCGHLENKTIIETQAMCEKIKAAVEAKRDPNFLIMVRTDSMASEGIDAAIERSIAYIQAGAEAIFPEALETPHEYEMFRKAIDVPLLANMTEFGKTPLYSLKELENFGFNIVIYPVSSLRIALGAIEDSFSALKEKGSLSNQVDKMQTRKRLYEILKYEEYNQFDNDLYNFKL